MGEGRPATRRTSSPPRPPDAGGRRFLVTGAYGCLGSWVVRELVDRGHPVVSFDIGQDPGRLALTLGERELDGVVRVRGDVGDLAQLERALDEHAITSVIHLAALQVPFCRDDPSRGARVNVVGTVNVLEAIRRRRDRMTPLVYASSIAVYDPLESDGADDAMAGIPSTLYGVYKRANELTARVYWADDRVASVGLRPHTIYGPGRDQGVTAAPTRAMLAAAAGVPYRIPYGGRGQLQYAPDAARAFVRAALAEVEGASVHNLAGHVVEMEEVVAAIVAAAPEAAELITHDPEPLAFRSEVDASSLAGLLGPPDDRPLADGVRDAVAKFRALLAAGRVAVGEPAGRPASGRAGR
jgi:UDP-glucuronate 4-epimerase